MNVQPTQLAGVVLIEPRLFRDARGFFKETYQRERYREAGIVGEFVQDNLSRSTRGVLRGLHLQTIQPQGKLVQCLRGEIFDVAVDLREGSPTFGQWTGHHLSEQNHLQLFLPPGCAHGFCTVSKEADVFYKCTDYYHPASEQTLLWNDPTVGIVWPTGFEPQLSEKDQQGRHLNDLILPVQA